MAKRFTDSRKWDDPWFLDLSNDYRMLWLYILDKCTHAGIYKHSNKLMGFFVENVSWEEFLKVCNGRLIKLSEDKYFIPKFIQFQYGELNNSVNCHKSVLGELKKERVDEQLFKGCSTLKNKNKNKDKDKNKDKRKANIFIKPSINDISEYCKERKNGIDPQYFYDKNESIGWVVGKNRSPMKDWKAVVRTWESFKKGDTLTKAQKNTIAGMKRLEERWKNEERNI